MNPLGKLPSIQDLLETPSVRHLADALGRNRLVTTASSVLDEVRQEVMHAASERAMPDIAQLAERITARIQQPPSEGLAPVINATGRIFDESLGGPPLPIEATEALDTMAHGYQEAVADTEGGAPTLIRRAEKRFAELAGAESAVWLSHRAAGAMMALAGSTANGSAANEGAVVISRGHMADLGDGYRVPDVIRATGRPCREVGTTNRTEKSDYEEALNESPGAIFYLLDAALGNVSSDSLWYAGELAAMTRQRELPLILDAGDCVPGDPSLWGQAGLPGLKQLADVRPSLLIVGLRYFIGRRCGVMLLGDRQATEAVSRHSQAAWHRPSVWEAVVLDAILPLLESPEDALRLIPALQAPTISLDNLKHRAERLAPRIEVSPLVASVELRETTIDVGGFTLPTWQLVLESAESRPHALAESLRRCSPGVLGTIEGSHLVLDLRSVLPSQDLFLAEAFERTSQEPDSTDAPSSDDSDA